MSLYILAILVLHLFPKTQAHTNFLFNSFNSSTLYQVEHSTIRSGAICLTNQSQRIFGRVLYPHPIQMKQSTSTNGCSSFSTTFVFAIIPFSQDPSRSGHGMAFLMTPNNSTVENSSTQYLGLLNNSIIRKPENHLFAVEFDTVESNDFDDIDSNHVGVDLNNLVSIKSKPAGYWTGNKIYPLDLNSGKNIQAWIDYDDAQQQLNVTIVEAGSFRPKKPLLSLQNMNLCSVFEQEMYVGFSASTGSVAEDHCVLAWSFSTNGSAPELDLSHLRPLIEGNKSNSRLIAGVTTSVLLVLILLVAAAVFFRWKRNKYRDIREEWEMEYWPHRFDYKELRIATKGFSEDQVVGSGGFGQVFKGVLPSNGQEVAVKSIFRETTEGMKEFIAEISSLGRLQHRNLVQIRGYCRREAKLFIVYDYMPNGSLEKMLFDKKRKNLLTWAQRYRILRDVGAGLEYLHEGWEKIVVHRDIKSSNVLLDSEFNAKLGDFGLARLYEHAENPRTTSIMGTLGYIAPEVMHTGKAAPSSDVFSYGILMLEVACGRRPVDPSLDASQTVMVDWVKDLYAEGKLMDAADPKLGGEYVGDEMEKVLKLGLLCSKIRPEVRPSIRQVLQIMEGEVGVPSLDLYEMSKGSRDSYASSGFSFASTSTSRESRSFTSTSISGEGRSFSSGKSEQK